MTSIERNMLRSIAIAVLLVVAGSILFSIGRMFLLGSYWSTAPWWMTFFVGVIIPIALVWAVIRLVIFIKELK